MSSQISMSNLPILYKVLLLFGTNVLHRQVYILVVKAIFPLFLDKCTVQRTYSVSSQCLEQSVFHSGLCLVNSFILLLT